MSDVLDRFEDLRRRGEVFYVGSSPLEPVYQVAQRGGAEQLAADCNRVQPGSMQVYTQQQVDEAKRARAAAIVPEG